MLAIAFLIGCYSYAILLLGLLHLISFYPVLLVTLVFILLSIFAVRIQVNFREYGYVLVLLVILFAVNLVGALGPELAFDSLWYHLTIPKLFIASHSVFFIKDNLFYYSLMPKLVEMLYVPAILLTNEIGAKLIHFSFGLLVCAAVYKLSRIYMTKSESMLCTLVFYSNLVVSWLSITAYSDLGRAFFETLSLIYLLYYRQKKSQKLLVSSALLFGFGIASKILTLGSFLGVILILFNTFKSDKKTVLKTFIVFGTISLAVAMPWFLIAFYHTANPVFPLFTQLGVRDFTLDLINPITILTTLVNTFLFAPDPLSPIYLICLPIILLNLRKTFKKYSPLFIYVCSTYVVWYFFAQSGGTRFLTVILPALTILSYVSIKQTKNVIIQKTVLTTIIVIALSTIFYRSFANAKFVPTVLGLESRQEFLMRNLNFSFGDFFDEDEEIKNIVGDDIVLVDGIHNLYYADFNYTLSQWPNSKNASYILVRGGMPKNYKKLQKVYENKKTKVTLFKI